MVQAAANYEQVQKDLLQSKRLLEEYEETTQTLRGDKVRSYVHTYLYSILL